VLVGANQLQPASTATVVHVEDGKTLTTDGPFAETKEVLGGYYLIDVESLDEALQAAAMIPSARYGHIEVRPIGVREAEVASWRSSSVPPATSAPARSRSSAASSVISTSPRTRCRTPSSAQPNGGRETERHATQAPGSSRLPGTRRSTGFAASRRS